MSGDKPARPPFAVGDRVRELQTNEERYVIEEDGDALIVLADETKGKHSNRRRWLKKNCTIITPCPFHIDDEVTLGTKNGTPGKIIEIKPHYNGKWLMYCVQRPKPSGDGNMTHWANEGAIHRIESTSSDPAQVEPVAYDLKAAGDMVIEFDGAPIKLGVQPPSQDYRIHQGTMAGFFEGKKSTDGMSAEPLNLDDMPKPSDGDAKLIDYWSALAGREARRADDAEELRVDAEARAEVAERNNKKLLEQINKLEAVIVKPVAPQQICWEIKIVKLQADLPESEKRWQDLLMDGWKENHISSVIDSRDITWTVIVFKKQVEFSPQPTRGTTNTHAILTGDYVAESRQPHPSQEVPAVGEIVIEGIVASRKVGPLEQSINKIGVEETSQLMTDFAWQGALARARQRIAAIPAFNRQLHTLKASN